MVIGFAVNHWNTLAVQVWALSPEIKRSRLIHKQLDPVTKIEDGALRV